MDRARQRGGGREAAERRGGGSPRRRLRGSEGPGFDRRGWEPGFLGGRRGLSSEIKDGVGGKGEAKIDGEATLAVLR